MPLIIVCAELLSLIPMPWQVSVFLFFGALAIYWIFHLFKYTISVISIVGMKLTELIVQLFLLPEYIVTLLFRSLHLRNVPGANLYSNVVQGVFGIIYQLFEKIGKFRSAEYSFPKRWVFFVCFIPVIAWFMQEIPDLRGTLTEEYIIKGFEFYIAMQQRVILR